jgi:hypothetical protein
MDCLCFRLRRQNVLLLSSKYSCKTSVRPNLVQSNDHISRRQLRMRYIPLPILNWFCSECAHLKEEHSLVFRQEPDGKGPSVLLPSHCRHTFRPSSPPPPTQELYTLCAAVVLLKRLDHEDGSPFSYDPGLDTVAWSVNAYCVAGWHLFGSIWGTSQLNAYISDRHIS